MTISTHAPSSRPHDLDRYFRDVSRTELLSADEESDLGYRIQAGDCEAREAMVKSNLRLVIAIAKRRVGNGVDLDDLISEGNLGLMHAAEYFKPQFGVRFSTYSQYWIKQSIDRLIKNCGKAIRIPSYMHQLVRNWNSAENEIECRTGAKPTSEETAKHLGISDAKLRHIIEAIRVFNASPLQSGEEVRTSLAEMVVDRRVSGSGMEACEEPERALRFVEELSDSRARIVLQLRFGLSGRAPMVLREVGLELGLTRERVRQIECEALASLRERLGDDYSR